MAFRLTGSAIVLFLVALVVHPLRGQETPSLKIDPIVQKVLDAKDAKELKQALDKYFAQLRGVVQSDMDTAEELLGQLEKALGEVKLEEDEAKSLVKRGLGGVSSFRRHIEGQKKLEEMIGKEAAPLKAEAWVNGTPLSEQDLKGKVVLLDFWAVWCGPCVATFPHLRDWHEKYAEQGLEIIGVTNYYKYAWDEEKGRPKRTAEATPEVEREMLEKFAEHHDLRHRFAIVPDRGFGQYYGVSGIPHAVVIDDSGIIRLMRVGSGKQNAEDIDKMLAKLLGDK